MTCLLTQYFCYGFSAPLSVCRGQLALFLIAAYEALTQDPVAIYSFLGFYLIAVIIFDQQISFSTSIDVVLIATGVFRSSDYLDFFVPNTGPSQEGEI